MAKTKSVLNTIHDLRKRYYQFALNKQALLKLISDSEISEQVYNSNAIENSTLTLEETDKILLQINLDRFISERELFETKNLARVVTYINTKAKEKELDIEMLLLLHKMLLSNIRDDVAGRLRKDNEWINVANHIAPNPNQVVELLEELLIEYYSSANQNIIKRVALLHLGFEKVHPFVDGNGRIGRVLNNYILIREGYVPINIKFIDRKLYYGAFQEFDANGKTAIMEEIIGKALTNSYHKRLAYLEGKKIVKLSDYAKNSDTSHSNLINKAKRQTIEAFMEKGVWMIGE